jgi:hypothetical protein
LGSEAGEGAVVSLADEIERLHTEATVGPWECVSSDSRYTHLCDVRTVEIFPRFNKDGSESKRNKPDHYSVAVGLFIPAMFIDDGRLVCVLRNAAPHLVAVLRAAEDVLDSRHRVDPVYGCDCCADADIENGSCVFCALRRALEECDGA